MIPLDIGSTVRIIGSGLLCTIARVWIEGAKFEYVLASNGMELAKWYSEEEIEID